MLAPFRNRSFTLLFCATVSSSFCDALMDVTLGWLVLELTDSPLSLGVFWAVRSSPNLVFGMIGGAVADTVDRKRLQIICFLIQLLGVCILGFLITENLAAIGHILMFTFLRGSIRAFDGPARQALVVDIVGKIGAMNGISLTSVGIRGIRIAAAALAGIVIHRYGSSWNFFMAAFFYLISTGLVSLVARVPRLGKSGDRSIWKNLTEGMRIVAHNRIVLALMIMAAVCEIFGFSSAVLLPVFARDILDVGAVGLGMFNSMTAVGGLVAGLGLASLGNYRHKGRLMMAIFLVFGVSLVLFANSPVYLLSLFLVGLIGITAAGHDAMQHVLLQLNVGDDQRGRAMGIWQLSIGFGVLGSVSLGGLAERLGAPLAQSIYGFVMIAVLAVLVFAMPKLRKL